MTETKNTAHPVLDERFITTIKGKEFVLYAGLLDLAHQKGLKGIHVEAIQYPTKDNGMEGICRAIVESQDGSEFTEVGDANPRNVATYIAEHVLRMAATRAKARALRDFTNIGITCLEELGDIDSVIGADDHKPKAKKRAAKSQPKSKPAKKDEKTADTSKSRVTSLSSETPKMSTAQKTAILNLSKRRGINEEELDTMAQEAYAVSFDQLTSKDAASFIRSLQVAA